MTNSRENENPINGKIDSLLKKINELNLETATNERINFHYRYINSQQKESKENDSKKTTSSDEDSQRYLPLPIPSNRIDRSSSLSAEKKVFTLMKLSHNNNDNDKNSLVNANTSSVQDFKKDHDTSLLYRYMISSPLIESEWEFTQNMKSIIKKILATDKYKKIYGNWACSSCGMECQKEYHATELVEILKKTSRDIFAKRCKNCFLTKIISSFRLYILPPGTQDVQNYGIIFTESSATGDVHTVKEATGVDLETNEDYYMQKCNSCKGIKDNIRSYIVHYEPLVLSSGGSEHKRVLCAKCQSGSRCGRTGTYFGYNSN
ncbi:3055_t:CDS:10 [Ambispora gerdemannii]|uniref:3055_t:CDS:1 n=1 Tax=Ambispora gerdemannii TaxID=144530 RepID=A0A9N9BJ58_9GLOM|nr:3055_t:CDS:10 [Ambispora gerdemannii]